MHLRRFSARRPAQIYIIQHPVCVYIVRVSISKQNVRKGRAQLAPLPILCTQTSTDIYNAAHCMCIHCVLVYVNIQHGQHDNTHPAIACTHTASHTDTHTATQTATRTAPQNMKSTIIRIRRLPARALHHILKRTLQLTLQHALQHALHHKTWRAR